jgi:hypothetical protein
VKANDRGWNRPFDDPIPMSRGRQLIPLQDAGAYITKLPNSEHTAPEWQAAMEALILVATLGGPTMLARIGVMQALNRGHVREFNLISTLGISGNPAKRAGLSHEVRIIPTFSQRRATSPGQLSNRKNHNCPTTRRFRSRKPCS